MYMSLQVSTAIQASAVLSPLVTWGAKHAMFNFLGVRNNVSSHLSFLPIARRGVLYRYMAYQRKSVASKSERLCFFSLATSRTFLFQLFGGLQSQSTAPSENMGFCSHLVFSMGREVPMVHATNTIA